jgi:hypothetical protein
MPKVQMNLSVDGALKEECMAICKKYDYPLTSVVTDLLTIWLRYAKNGEGGQGNGKSQ